MSDSDSEVSQDDNAGAKLMADGSTAEDSSDFSDDLDDNVAQQVRIPLPRCHAIAWYYSARVMQHSFTVHLCCVSCNLIG